MKFTFKNTEYRIVFSQLTETNEIPGLGPTAQRSTVARIWIGKRDNETLVTEAKVTHYFKDQFNFEEGRKRALKAALGRMDLSEVEYTKSGFPGWAFEHVPEVFLEFRTAAWNAYHNRIGGLYEQQATARAQKFWSTAIKKKIRELRIAGNFTNDFELERALVEGYTANAA